MNLIEARESHHIQRLIFRLILIILMTLSSIRIWGQDGNYWSEQYGTRSMLLGGTVNARVSDLGAVYYNPGRLAQIENPAFVISAKVYEWTNIKIEEGVSDDQDLKQSNFGGAPSLLAGTFTLPFLKKHKFAYSFLTRTRFNPDFFIRADDEGELIDVFPGEEYFAGQLLVRGRVQEEWMGLTWSYAVTPSLSVGLSNFFVTRNQSARVAMLLSVHQESNKVAQLFRNRQVSSESNGLLWKPGIAWNPHPKVNLGVTITTPVVQVRGTGNTIFEDFLIGVDTTGDGDSDDVFVSNLQGELKARYRSPWAVSLGLGLQLGKVVLHLSTEWYDRVGRYTVLETEPFTPRTSADILQLIVVNQMKSVWNAGVGMELALNEKFSAYGSFATDFSAVVGDVDRIAEFKNEISASTFRADFYNLGGGFSLETKWAELTLGATYAGASQNIRRPINLPEEGDEPIFDSGERSEVKYNRWRFVLGFSFPFANNLAKKVGVDKEE